jgi:virginiamycin B lyase
MKKRFWTWGIALASMATIASVAALLPMTKAAGSPMPPVVTLFGVPTGRPTSAPSLTAGPDGAVWYATGREQLGRMTAAGKATEMDTPIRTGYVTAGSDGNLWFTDGAGHIAKMSTSGETLAQYTVPGCSSCGMGRLATGPDGAIWFSESNTSKIARMTTDGELTEFEVVSQAQPGSITTGPDGALWFTESIYNAAAGKIGRITTSGEVTEYPVSEGTPGSITAGPDGALWFTSTGNKIGRMTTTGETVTYPVTVDGSVSAISAGQDGNLWFTVSGVTNNNNETSDAQVGSITTSGEVTLYPAPVTSPPDVNYSHYAPAITPGPDGNMWFTISDPARVGKIHINAAEPEAPANFTATSPNKVAQFSWDSVPGATSYNLYQDGQILRSVTGTSFSIRPVVPEGLHTYRVTAVIGDAESKVSNAVNVQLDFTAPTIDTPSWNTNPVAAGQNTTLSIAASDALSGVKQVSCVVPTIGETQLSYDSILNVWKATFGANLTVNTYDINCHATDNAGNDSAYVYEILTVYTTANGDVSGHYKVVPTSNTLPVALDTGNNPAKLIMGFTSLVAPSSGSFDVNYTVKQNKDGFYISSKSITSVLIPDATHATVVGKADLTKLVNGVQTVTTDVSVKFEIVLNANGSDDHVVMKVYNPGVNTTSGTPAFTVNDAPMNGSKVMIH